MKLLLAILMIMTSALFGIKLTADISKNEPEKDKVSSNTKSSLSYVLKYEDGQIYLYEDNYVIDTLSDINISTLPYTDRENLCEGIELETAEEAYKLIEDLDG